MKLTHKELIASMDLKNQETGARMQQGNAGGSHKPRLHICASGAAKTTDVII